MTYSYQSIYFDRPIIPGRVLDIFLPDKRTRKTALFFVHGGGWRGGSRTIFHAIMQAFVGEGFVCASTDYRLSGTTILDQIMDVRHGYDLFIRELRQMGINDIFISVHGSSAGAHLAALLAMARPGECGEPLALGDYSLQTPWIRPAAATLQSVPITFEPWDDIFPPSLAGFQKIVGQPFDQNPELHRRVSPITYLSKDTPPIFFLDAANEEMFPRELNWAFVEKARQLGCRMEYKVYAKAEHGFFYDVTRRCQKEAFQDMLKFVQSI